MKNVNHVTWSNATKRLLVDNSNRQHWKCTNIGALLLEYFSYNLRHKHHTYKVKLTDANVRHVHVNKIRKFRVQTQIIGVIFEADT